MVGARQFSRTLGRAFRAIDELTEHRAEAPPGEVKDQSYTSPRCTSAGVPQSPRIEGGLIGESSESDPAQLTIAGAVLAWVGVRLMTLEGGMVVGVWSDLDGPEVRAAIVAFGPDQPIAYLDGPGIPMKYQERRVSGEPVPMSVLAAMEQNPTAPWAVRDKMLTAMKWHVDGTPWAEWQAAAHKRLRQKQRDARELHFRLGQQTLETSEVM